MHLYFFILDYKKKKIISYLTIISQSIINFKLPIILILIMFEYLTKINFTANYILCEK